MCDTSSGGEIRIPLQGVHTNKTISKRTFIKSLLTSLFQREDLYPSLVKRGEGRFSGKCGFTYELLSKIVPSPISPDSLRLLPRNALPPQERGTKIVPSPLVGEG